MPGHNRRREYDEAAAQGCVADGIPCRECGCRHSYVVRTERLGETVRRTRRCRNCGREFYTVESA